MSYSPWDWADRFRLSEAACLIAGVPVESKWEQTLDEVPVDAMPVFRRLVEAVAVGAALLNRPDDPKYPKERTLKTLWPEMPPSSLPIVNAKADTGEANESLISRAELHVMTGWKVSREEIHRWVHAMGIYSAYDFSAVHQSDVDAKAEPEPPEYIFDDLPQVAPRAAAGPIFHMTKAALIAAHEHEWPTIRSDLADAKDNQLAKAKAGKRGWYEGKALEWAKSKNKLTVVDTPENTLTQGMNLMAGLPGRKHNLED